jgi:hypothetical protein
MLKFQVRLSASARWFFRGFFFTERVFFVLRPAFLIFIFWVIFMAIRPSNIASLLARNKDEKGFLKKQTDRIIGLVDKDGICKRCVPLDFETFFVVDHGASYFTDSEADKKEFKLAWDAERKMYDLRSNSIDIMDNVGNPIESVAVTVGQDRFDKPPKQ